VRWADLGASGCSIARALSVVGDRWTLLLLREAFLGATRFEEFHGNTGAARHIVAARLQDLVAHGVLDRAQYHDRPARFEYQLTPKGTALYPVIVSLLAWGDEWMLDGREPTLAVVHEPCGATVTPELRCPTCGRRVDSHDTHHLMAGRDVPAPPHESPGAAGRAS
jgi:DNA-binding HxlR family transcriptional regulator